MKLRLTGTLVLVLGSACLASASAYAGNGHGNGNGNGGGPAAAVGGVTEHGNSASAPGQQKAEETQAPTATVADTSTTAQEGVKPANDTAHDTHAVASSDETKLYGNGKTAGEIAMQNGATGSTRLHGPGNSQPHKAAPCSGGHEVDVHALKASGHGSCGTSSDPDPIPKATPDPDHTQDPGQGPSSNPTNTPSSSPGTTPAAGGMVPGVVSEGGRKSNPKTRGVVGVLGATQGAAARGTLPFTGTDLWSTVFVAVALILIGLALCQRARTLPVRESDEGARP
ncbi:MAG: hypothetical protein QOH23_1398 [Gaiellaceae bacterium]|jgi:hypothetical protein|nr:hypothetical protein [Gaiellaceae bacterium]